MRLKLLGLNVRCHIDWYQLLPPTTTRDTVANDKSILKALPTRRNTRCCRKRKHLTMGVSSDADDLQWKTRHSGNGKKLCSCTQIQMSIPHMFWILATLSCFIYHKRNQEGTFVVISQTSRHRRNYPSGGASQSVHHTAPIQGKTPPKKKNWRFHETCNIIAVEC